MSKFGWLVIILIIGGLIISGIVEVRINKEKLFSLPDITSSVVREKASYEQGRAYAVGLKRRAEQLVVQNKEKRLVLALLYVKSDAARLQELIDKNQDSQKATILLPQSELLIASIGLVRRTAEKAPTSVVADLKQESEESFTQAKEALQNLQALHEEYEEIGEEFDRLNKSLADQINELNLEQGTPDQSSEEAPAEEEEEEIPLKF